MEDPLSSSRSAQFEFRQIMHLVVHLILLTCHFRQAGLKLGRPFRASSSVVKTCSVFASLIFGARKGGSFSAYVANGNRSKTRFKGAGTEKMLFDGFPAAGRGVGVPFGSADWYVTSEGGSSLDIAVHLDIMNNPSVTCKQMSVLTKRCRLPL